MGKKSRKAASKVPVSCYPTTRSIDWFGKSIVKVFFISLAVALAVLYPYLHSALLGINHVPFARSIDYLSSRFQNVSCSKEYANYPVFAGCTPTKICGRCVKDGLVSAEEVQIMKKIVESGLVHGGSSGGASILDLHSGAMSKEDKFINVYKSLSKDQLSLAFPPKSINTYITLKNRVKTAIANEFGIDPAKLHLTKPTFFSRMTTTAAKTKHDEYWHSHIDKIQYGSFDYTALIYLSTYGQDFEGGQFIFDDKHSNVTIEPKGGRLSFFTSGFENPHHVEKVTSGTRYAVTIAFTCDPKHAIKDPTFQA